MIDPNVETDPMFPVWEQMVKHHIVCNELGYPLCEAHYIDIKDWETKTGRNWYRDVLEKV